VDSLTNAQIRDLKSRAQRLKATLKVGKDGLSPRFIAALDEALNHNELLKVKFDDFKEEKKELTPQLAVLEIPPVEAQGRMTVKMQDEVMRTVNAYNSILPDLARRNGATFLALPGVPKPYTIDGVHLNSDGYLAWDKAVMQAAAMICG